MVPCFVARHAAVPRFLMSARHDDCRFAKLRGTPGDALQVTGTRRSTAHTLVIIEADNHRRRHRSRRLPPPFPQPPPPPPTLHVHAPVLQLQITRFIANVSAAIPTAPLPAAAPPPPPSAHTAAPKACCPGNRRRYCASTRRRCRECSTCRCWPAACHRVPSTCSCGAALAGGGGSGTASQGSSRAVAVCETLPALLVPSFTRNSIKSCQLFHLVHERAVPPPASPLARLATWQQHHAIVASLRKCPVAHCSSGRDIHAGHWQGCGSGRPHEGARCTCGMVAVLAADLICAVGHA